MSIRPIDLRDILEYVPRFRNHIFVLSIDGSIIADENFDSLLTDIAVLQSLNIKVIICHGVAHQIRALSELHKQSYTNDRGDGPTDNATLELALEATAQASSTIMKGLAKHTLPYSFSNAIEARPIGVEDGEDQQHTGMIDHVHAERIFSLLNKGEIPVFSPIVYDQKGRTLRVNSDQMAASIAKTLKASKLIYLSSRPRLTIGNKNILNCSAEELQKIILDKPDEIDPLLLSKAKHGIKVLAWDTDRVHILDGRIDGCLLIEIFDKVGLGTMIHSNEYDRIRSANEDDLADIYTLVKQASRTKELVTRSMEEVKERLNDFFVYEVDNSIMGCTCLIPYDNQISELASVCVQPYHQGKGVGQKLAIYTINKARERGMKEIFALSTKASEFFTEQLGFKISDLEILPIKRKQNYLSNKRNSIILHKYLQH